MMLRTIVLALAAASPATAAEFGPWSTARAVTELNTPSNDGCPIESPDGLQFFIASNRPGTLGGNDIWVSERASITAPWGPPQNLGRPINSEANDFCPTPLPGDWLFFVSERPGPETCNAGPNSGDIYLSALRRVWRTPVHIGCEETGDGPNSAAAAGKAARTRAGAKTIVRSIMCFSSRWMGGTGCVRTRFPA